MIERFSMEAGPEFKDDILQTLPIDGIKGFGEVIEVMHIGWDCLQYFSCGVIVS